MVTLFCGRLDRRPQRWCWPLTVCPISSASGSDAESYNAEYCETVSSRLQFELIHGQHQLGRLPVTSLATSHSGGPVVGQTQRGPTLWHPVLRRIHR